MHVLFFYCSLVQIARQRGRVKNDYFYQQDFRFLNIKTYSLTKNESGIYQEQEEYSSPG